MLKRIIPVLASVALICCVLAMPASAADNRLILNYRDYIVSSSVDYLGQKWDFFQIPKEHCAVMTIDKNGTQTHEPGVFFGNMIGVGDVGQRLAVNAYWPGCWINNVFFDASNFTQGSKVSIDFLFTLNDADYQTALTCVSDICVQYFDSDFNFIGYQCSEPYYWDLYSNQINGRMTSTLTLSTPVDAAYLGFYCTVNLEVYQTNDKEFGVEWWFGSPRFECYSMDSDPPFDHPTGTPQDYFDDNILWLRDVVDEFLDFEVAPGFSLNKIMYVILVVGVLFWFLKVIS